MTKPIPLQEQWRARCRENITEYLGFVKLYSNIGQEFAEAGDDPGLKYALSNLRAYARYAFGVFDAMSGAPEAPGAARADVEGREPSEVT
jgi:hypothetical protein